METEEKKFLKLRERAKKLGINLHWKFRGVWDISIPPRFTGKREIAIVKASEVRQSKDNPTGCMSPDRYLGLCQNCEIFKRTLQEKNTLRDVLKRLKCKPRLDPEQKAVVREYLVKKAGYLRSLESMKKAGSKFPDAGWKKKQK